MHIYGIHPTLGVPVRSDGLVLVKDRGRSKTCHWTFGSKNNRGYLHVKINGKLYSVHILVLETFVGPCPDGMECDHSDRNRCNNALTNLRWVPRTQNLRNTIKNDRVDARGGTHWYEDKKQYGRENNARYRNTHKLIRFSDGKRRWIPNELAPILLSIPVKERKYA